jgi:hypothetical protein
MEFSVWSVIQWVLIVLAAAFIGHFGKVLAQSVLAKIRAKKTDPSPAGPSLPPIPNDSPQADATIASPEGKIGAPPSSAPSGTAADRADKKMLKTLAKQAKKASKKK